MGNMPILYKNAMDGLPTQFSRDVFLWAVDKFPDDRMAFKAEEFAREVDKYTRTLKTLIEIRQFATFRNGGILLDEDQKANFLRFCQARHANWRTGGNIKTAMPELVD